MYTITLCNIQWREQKMLRLRRQVREKNLIIQCTKKTECCNARGLFVCLFIYYSPACKQLEKRILLPGRVVTSGAKLENLARDCCCGLQPPLFVLAAPLLSGLLLLLLLFWLTVYTGFSMSTEMVLSLPCTRTFYCLA